MSGSAVRDARPGEGEVPVVEPETTLPDHPLLRGAVPRPAGEAAVVVEFGEHINPDLQRRATALADALALAAPPGLCGVLPTYRSVLIDFDPDRTDAATLLAALGPAGDASDRQAAREWDVPACLDGAAAEDADEAAAALGIAADDLREHLLARPLTVGMYGFAPGFPYLTGLDPALAVPRRPVPRPPVPPGSVIIAAGQAAIAPSAMPTGWYVVGRTAARMFEPARAERGEPPVPFAPGDRLHLVPVDAAALRALADDPDGGVRPHESDRGRTGGA